MTTSAGEAHVLTSRWCRERAARNVAWSDARQCPACDGDPDHMTRRIRLVTHNPGNDPDQLEQLIADTGHPHAIAYQECRKLHRAPRGYQRVAITEPPHPDHLGTMLLVRNDVPVLHRRLLPCGGPWWTGPKHGLRHPPPIHVGATVELAGIRVDLLSVHGVWTGPRDRNGPTARAELVAIREWMLARQTRNHGTRPVIPLGDWNRRAAELWPLAADTHARVELHGVDGALGVNVRQLESHQLRARYGPERAHHPVVVTALLQNPRPRGADL